MRRVCVFVAPASSSSRVTHFVGQRTPCFGGHLKYLRRVRQAWLRLELDVIMADN